MARERVVASCRISAKVKNVDLLQSSSKRGRAGGAQAIKSEDQFRFRYASDVMAHAFVGLSQVVLEARFHRAIGLANIAAAIVRVGDDIDRENARSSIPWIPTALHLQSTAHRGAA